MHCAAVRSREREVSLWHRSDPCFYWFPIIIKTLHHVFAFFSLYTDVSEARVGEHALQSFRVSQSEREMDYIPLRQEKAAEYVGKNTPHWCPVWRRDDTYCRAAPNTK